MNLSEWTPATGYVVVRVGETKGSYTVQMRSATGSAVGLIIPNRYGEQLDPGPAIGELLRVGQNPYGLDGKRAGLQWPDLGDGIPAHERTDWSGWRVLFNPYILTEDAQLDPLNERGLWAIWCGNLHALVSPDGVLHALHPDGILCKSVPDPLYDHQQVLKGLILPAGVGLDYTHEQFYPGVGEVLASPVPEVAVGSLLVFPRKGVAMSVRLSSSVQNGLEDRILVVPWQNVLGTTTTPEMFHLPVPAWLPRT